MIKEMLQDRVALDRAAVSARTFDNDGHMHVVDNPISRSAVNPYNGSEIPNWQALGLDPNKIYYLLRDPEELKKAAPSFDGKPLLIIHKGIHSGDHDHEIVCGTVGAPYWDDPYLKVGRLTVWTDEAKRLIDSGKQKELSSAYRYRMDPSPGTFEGKRYDGVMRDIDGSHVAIVTEGRAGHDVVVQDQNPFTRGLDMKTTLTPKGAVAQGALIAYLQPRLAQDKKIDLRPMLKGVSVKTWKADKPRIAADMKRQTKGLLAKDANVDDVMELLDALEEVIPEMEVEKLGSVENAGAGDPDAATDADDTALRDFLKSLGLSDEDIETACAKAAAPAATDASSALGDIDEGAAVVSAPGGSSGAGNYTGESARGGTGGTSGRGAEDRGKGAKDTEMKDMVKKSAMDAAVNKARREAADEAVTRVNAIHEAKEYVSPWVGKLPQAYDSADKVLRAALATLGVGGADTLHADALRPVLDAQPKPGDRPRSSTAHVIAQDAATVKARDEMFPNYNRLKN